MDTKRAKELLEGMSRKNILVVGDVMLDHYISGTVERINPEAPVPILDVKEEWTSSGGAGNVAKNLAFLGAQAKLISVCGDDADAKLLADTCSKEGYATVLIPEEGRPTTRKIRYVTGSQHLLRVDHEKKDDVSEAVAQKLIAAITEAVNNVDGVIVSDYAKGCVTLPVAEGVMAMARERKILVLGDVKPSRINFFTGVDYISPNLKEAYEYLALSQFDNGNKSDQEIAESLRETFDTNVFLTLSSRGMFVLSKEDGAGSMVEQVYTSDEEVLDTSGCGDTAAAVVLLAMMSGASMVEAADLGNAAGAATAGKIGAASVSPEELLDVLGRARGE